MVLEHLPASTVQARGECALEHLPAATPLVLRKQLDYFIVSCQVEGFSPKTIHNYKWIIDRFVTYCLANGVREAGEITTQDIRAYLLRYRERVGAYALHDYFRAIRRWLNWLVGEKIIRENPANNIKTPQIPKTLINPLKPEDIRRLLTLCEGDRFLEVRNRAIILVFLDTGVRVSELARMKVADYDVKRGLFRVMGKGARERLVAVATTTQKALLHYLLMRTDDLPEFWLTEERRPLQARGVQMFVRRLKQRAGVKGVRCSPHTLRHTFATRSLMNGAGEFDVQRLLGHATLAMTRRYSETLRSEHAAEAHKHFSPVEHLKL